MKNLCKPICFILTLLIIFSANISTEVVFAQSAWPAPPAVNAASAIVIDVDTGAVLYEKEIHAQHYPASITKIMTTLLALENTSLQDTVTFSYDSVHKIEGTHIGIKDGEQLTMEQCLYAVMLGSANEVAYAVAEHTGQTFENFVAMMNQRAAELGCTETHFNNPHGLPDETHVTSAHDMALIAQAAYKNAAFRKITKTSTFTIPPTNLTAETRPVPNHHKMLQKGAYKYEYCTGGKTGYTNAARYTLVTYAEKDGMNLACVVMQCDTSENQYTDTKLLFDYVFNNFRKVTVTEDELGLQLSSDGLFPIEHTPLSEDAGKIALSNAELVIPNQAQITDIASSINFTGEKSGEIADISCTFEDHYVGKVAITYTPNKSKAEQTATNTKTREKESKPFPVKKVLLILFVVLCVTGFIGVVLYAIRNGLFEIEKRSKEPTIPKRSRTRKRNRRHRR